MARVAFLFPGQGAQYVGMGQQLYQTVPAARQLFDQAASILGYDLRGPIAPRCIDADQLLPGGFSIPARSEMR